MGNKLYRSNSDKVLLGTLGGIAEYLNINSTIVRVVFLLVLFSGNLFGIGTIIYFLTPIFIPNRYDYQGWYGEERSRYEQYYDSQNDNTSSYDFNSSSKRNVENKKHTKSFLGVVLVLVGVYLLARKYIDLSKYLDIAREYWPILLVVLGIYILVSEIDKD